jgi:hypothetical protein
MTPMNTATIITTMVLDTAITTMVLTTMVLGHCHNTSNSSNFLIIMRSFDASAYANGNFLINLMRQRKGNFVIKMSE